jgi:hypothetical protein
MKSRVYQGAYFPLFGYAALHNAEFPFAIKALPCLLTRFPDPCDHRERLEHSRPLFP